MTKRVARALQVRDWVWLILRDEGCMEDVHGQGQFLTWRSGEFEAILRTPFQSISGGRRQDQRAAYLIR